MGFVGVLRGRGESVCFSEGLWGFLLLFWFEFLFLWVLVSRYNPTKAQMTSPGHSENLPVAAQFLQ